MPRTAALAPFKYATVGDLLDQLAVAPSRILMDPAPGSATVKDVIRCLQSADKQLVELVDGTLVEKAMSTDAAFVAVLLARLIGNFSDANGDLGMVLGADGAAKILKGLVRIPDVSFTLWERIPDRVVPKQPIADLAPDLAVEVLSPGNSRTEIDRKRKEYFRGGVRLVWIIDPDSRTVRVYTDAATLATLQAGDSLDGGDVLPGFSVPVNDLFARLAKPRSKRKKKPR